MKPKAMDTSMVVGHGVLDRRDPLATLKVIKQLPESTLVLR